MNREARKKIKSAVAIIAVVAICLTLFFIPKDNKKPSSESISFEHSLATSNDKKGVDYDHYINNYSTTPSILNEVNIDCNLLIKEGATENITVNLTEGLANIRLTYKIKSNNNSNGGCSIAINGVQPFAEANEFSLFRRWETGKYEVDSRGNQYTADLKESESFIVADLCDRTGLHSEPFKFYFKSGENVISITSLKDDIELKSISLHSPIDIKDYKEVSKDYPKINNVNETKIIQAEFPLLRTNSSISELCDRASMTTYPTFEGLQVWNSIGGTGYATTGQSATWEFEVSETGCYQISIRFKQNFLSGVATFRKILIDDVVPFAEMQSVKFAYDNGWQVMTLASESGEPFDFYLKEGRHTLTLEVTLGEQCEMLNAAKKTLQRLNGIYRKIVTLTGSSPDEYRDYQIANNLPETIAELDDVVASINEIGEWLLVNNGEKGEGTAVIDKLIWQLEEFAEFPESIPKSLSTFQGNISGFGDWIQSQTSQPLTLDSFEVSPSGSETLLVSEANFLKRFFYSLKMFIKSFADDYGVIGNSYDENKTTEVWMALGRDQYQIIKELTDNDFTKRTSINVNLKLVAGGLLQAIVAGIAPDVYLFATEAEPVNYASRGALLDLKQFDDYDVVAKRFSPEAIVPYEYGGGVYGIPLQQNFLVMLTRDDLLEEIGLEVPETWDDIYGMLTTLQQNNMEFAFPIPSNANVSSFALLYLQNDAEIYKDNGLRVNIDSEIGIDTFKKWTKLYSDYSLLMAYDFPNRFRSGEMPIGIVDFSTYNTLEIFAPEISGLWSMHPIPKSTNSNGVDESISISTSTAAIIMNDTDYPKDSWEFVKWFTSEEAQYNYSTAIENKLGASGRYYSANISAFNRLPWSSETLKTLEYQRESALGIEQVPGGYFLSRHIDNIFRQIINQKSNVRETVTEYAKVINEEITRKRKEFGLEVETE